MKAPPYLVRKEIRRLTQILRALEREFPTVSNPAQMDLSAAGQEAAERIRLLNDLIGRLKLALIRRGKTIRDKAETIISTRDLRSNGAGPPTGTKNTQNSPPRNQRRREFRTSDDYRTICFNGKSHQLTRNQSVIVRLLHAAHRRGTPAVGQETLLKAIEAETSRVRDSFKKSPLWGTLVVPGERRGTYRLNLE